MIQVLLIFQSKNIQKIFRFPLFQFSAMAESLGMYKLNVWFYSFCLKLVPCSLLLVITVLLTRALLQFSRNQLQTGLDRIQSIRGNKPNSQT